MLIDSHCHLDFPCFNNQLEKLLNKLTANNIDKLIIPGTKVSGIITLSSQYQGLYYALGIHPHFLDLFDERDLLELKEAILKRDNKCVALGEIGLDKNVKCDPALQEFVFVEQLKLAQQLSLPIILHCVKKQNRVLTLLNEVGFTQGGVYHAFSGSLEVATEFIKRGFKLGIGGVITYPNSTKTRNTVANIPLESIVLETDAPDMPIYKQSTKDNTPLNIIPIFDCLVELRSESKSQLATQIYNNVHNIFALSND